jgi:hypothetical protein
MRSDNAHDLPSLNIAFRLGDFQKTHHVDDLRVESLLLRHSIVIWVFVSFASRSSRLDRMTFCASKRKIFCPSARCSANQLAYPAINKSVRSVRYRIKRRATYRVTSSTEAYWPGEVLRILSNSSQHPSSASHASLTCAALTAFRRFATGPVNARLMSRQASYFVSVRARNVETTHGEVDRGYGHF